MINSVDIWISLKYILPKTREKFFSLITVFSFLGIALGVATLIIVMSVMNGFREELTNKILGINGHLKVINIFNDHDDEKIIINNIKEKINNSKVHAVISSQGLISVKNYTSGVLIKGVEYNFFQDREIFNNDFSEQQISSLKNNEGVLIGRKLANKLNLRKGDYVNIISSKSYETLLGKIPRQSTFKIIGFFEIGMYEYDTSLIFFPITLLRNFLDTKSTDHYEILVPNFDNLDDIKSELKEIIPNYSRILDWRQLNPSLFNAIEVEKNVMFIILTLIIIVAAFNLISSMMMLVSTKRKDIGILRVLGVSKFQLLKIFIINGLVVGVLGTILGLVLGLLFCLNINEIKNFIELFSGSDLFSEEIYFFSKLPIILDFNQIFNIVLISMSLSFFATIYPSIKASKVDPINLIKWE